MRGCDRPGCINPREHSGQRQLCADCRNDGDEVRSALGAWASFKNANNVDAWVIETATRNAILRLIARAEK